MIDTKEIYGKTDGVVVYHAYISFKSGEVSPKEAQLKNFSGRYGICLLLVHYTRKQTSDDKFDMISGTNGLLQVSTVPKGKKLRI